MPLVFQIVLVVFLTALSLVGGIAYVVSAVFGGGIFTFGLAYAGLTWAVWVFSFQNALNEGAVFPVRLPVAAERPRPVTSWPAACSRRATASPMKP